MKIWKKPHSRKLPFKKNQKNEEPNNNGQEGCHEDEVQPFQPLPRDWKYASSHPKDLIIGEVSKRVSTRSIVHNVCSYIAFIYI